MTLQSAYGLLAQALVFGAVTALLPLGAFRGRVALAATALSLMIGIAPIMLAVFGPPSLTLLGLALWAQAGQTPGLLTWRPALLVVGLGSALALSAAIMPGDLYALGYQPWPLLATLMPVGLALWWRGRTDWLLILGGGLLAYAGGLFANLWGALLDPLLILLAAAVLLRELLVRLSAARHR